MKPVPMMYSNAPRILTPREIAAIDAQCITRRYEKRTGEFYRVTGGSIAWRQV